jgi:hypothetical protein
MKKSNWTIALHQQIAKFNDKPFAWGTHDCCTFAADCVLAMTGIDHLADHRGGYKSAIGAARRLEKVGGIEAGMTTLLGAPIDPKFAQRGDVVCFTSPLGDTAGVCMGSNIAAPGLDGMAFTPMSEAFKAWRV